MPEKPLTIAIVPSAKAGHYDVLAGVGAARSQTADDIDALLMKLQPGDTVIYDCRTVRRAA